MKDHLHMKLLGAVNVECYSLARMRRFFATGSSAGKLNFFFLSSPWKVEVCALIELTIQDSCCHVV